MLSVKASASETLKPGLAGMKAAEKAAPNAELVQMIGDLTALLVRVDFMTTTSQVISRRTDIERPFLHTLLPISLHLLLYVHDLG